MSIDEMNGMIKAYKEVKKYCETIKQKKEKDIVDKSVNSTLTSVIYFCNKFEQTVEENIDGEIERMYEMMEGKKDDRQDHRDV
tara:strand:- start:65 stop:313 length:249 start_codon:yes stop_codon:yes gene_type:complete